MWQKVAVAKDDDVHGRRRKVAVAKDGGMRRKWRKMKLMKGGGLQKMVAVRKILTVAECGTAGTTVLGRGGFKFADS